MSHITEPRIGETTTTTGTGPFATDAALTSHRRFSAVCSASDTFWVDIEAVDSSGNPTGDWVEGLGTYSAGNEVTVTTVYRSSNANLAVTFGAGTKFVRLIADARQLSAMPRGGTTGQALTKVNGNDYATQWSTVATDAASVTFTPAGTIAATDVQAAIQELDTEKEVAANKDASGGYAGLTLFKLNLRNAANTITSFFTTAATVARTWTMPDKDGTVAMTSDITGTNSGTNTGDQNLFSTIAVSGQSSVVADSATDTLTLVAGTNITITTDASTDSITINASGGGGGAGLTANTFTDTQTIEKAVGATSTDGLVLATTTAATNGNQSKSPRTRWLAKGYGTGAGTSQDVEFAVQVEATQGTSPLGYWSMYNAINGGAFSRLLQIRSDGLFLPESGVFAINGQMNANGGVFSGSYVVCSGNLYFGGGTDAAMCRSAASALAVLKSPTTTDYGDLILRGLQFGATLTVGTLPSAASSGGLIYRVSDSSGPVVGSTVSSGGSTKCTVQSDGSAWKVIWIA